MIPIITLASAATLQFLIISNVESVRVRMTTPNNGNDVIPTSEREYLGSQGDDTAQGEIHVDEDTYKEIQRIGSELSTTSF